jgi:hypothetical protein
MENAGLKIEHEAPFGLATTGRIGALYSLI